MPSEKEIKVFNDPIHGHMEIDPLLSKIINTRQFNRLRNLKQMGGTYYVYPGASHNRFEHSIGVGHLAGKLVEALNKRQPKLKITPADILCVKIAGLCHDLGHGPFSHLFDSNFIPAARPGYEWKHEKASREMFNYLVEQNKLEPVMEEYGLDLSKDLIFIQELIAGPLNTQDSSKKWPYKGRSKDKAFLYEIVANKRTGIDVDKWDYFARDCHHLGIQNDFDYHRFLKFARVCEVDGQKRICTRDKEVNNLYDMFHTRHRIYRNACYHRVSNIIEHMVTEAFVKADQHIQFEGKKKMHTLSTAMDDMQAYIQLTDDVFEKILNSSSPKLEESRQILNHIVHRRHPRFVGEIQVETEMQVTKEMAKTWEQELGRYKPQGRTKNVRLNREDFVVKVIRMDYGMKKENPINKVHFYKKSNPDKAFRITKNQVSKLFPRDFDEQWIRVYCKKIDKKSLEAAKDHFDKWQKDKNFPVPFPGSTQIKQWIEVFFKETRRTDSGLKEAMDHFVKWCNTQDGDEDGDGEENASEPAPKRKRAAI